MKKSLLLFLFLATSCQTSFYKPAPPSSDGYFSQKKEGNSTLTLEEHPEFPLVLSSETPAWKVGVWLVLIIIGVCTASAVGRYVHGNWRPFWGNARTKLKNLTKKKK